MAKFDSGSRSGICLARDFLTHRVERPLWYQRDRCAGSKICGGLARLYLGCLLCAGKISVMARRRGNPPFRRAMLLMQRMEQGDTSTPASSCKDSCVRARVSCERSRGDTRPSLFLENLLRSGQALIKVASKFLFVVQCSCFPSGARVCENVRSLFQNGAVRGFSRCLFPTAYPQFKVSECANTGADRISHRQYCIENAREHREQDSSRCSGSRARPVRSAA